MKKDKNFEEITNFNNVSLSFAQNKSIKKKDLDSIKHIKGLKKINIKTLMNNNNIQESKIFKDLIKIKKIENNFPKIN